MNNEQQPASWENQQKDILQNNDAQPVVIPIIEEQITVAKQTVETGKIYIKKQVYEQQEELNIPLLHDEYDIEHVPVNIYIEETPQPVRYEGSTMIVSVVKEVLVKKMVLVEEIRINKRTVQTTDQQNVTLRKEDVTIERQAN